MKLGRNQLIASVAFGVTFLASIPIVVWMDAEQAKTWLDWSASFVPIAVGSVIGASAVVKVAESIKGVKQ